MEALDPLHTRKNECLLWVLDLESDRLAIDTGYVVLLDDVPTVYCFGIKNYAIPAQEGFFS